MVARDWQRWRKRWLFHGSFSFEVNWERTGNLRFAFGTKNEVKNDNT